MSSSNSNEAETAELALYRLEEIDELLDNVNSDADDMQSATLAQYLRSGRDLESALQLQDEQLRSLKNTFIQEHVAQADQIAQLYHGFGVCEEHIVKFEEEILTFQRKLEGNANDIAFMQQQTDGLVRKVNNRRQVSNKINEVYSALQKCDSFCEVISSKEVDANYLSNLHELDRRLAFLSRNKALQHSAVDNEIRPKLTAAAQKAGSKLQRFLTKKILALTEDPSRMLEEQQTLEQNAQFAFRFLQLYNSPVAKEITKLYIRYMSELYNKQFRQLLTEFSYASAVHADPLEPLVSAEEVREIVCNRDRGSPAGTQVNGNVEGFPGRTLARRERSVSQHMRGFTEIVSSSVGAGSEDAQMDVLRLLRPATFDDTVKVVKALGVRYGKLYVDEALAAQLSKCNSWAWRFLSCFQQMVNACEAECRFIGNFFCVAVDVEGGEDYNDAERIARAVLGRAVTNIETSIREEVPLVMERTEVLAALRVLDTVKQHLCTSLDPIPLLLLSGVMEMSKAALRSSLRTAFHNDEPALAFLPSRKLSPFHRGTAAVNCNSWADLLANKPYCVTLGPHPLVHRVCSVLARLEYLNVVAPRTAFSAGSQGGLFDPSVAAFVKSCLEHLMAFVSQLKGRHRSVFAQQVFACVNAYSIFATWRDTMLLDGCDTSSSASASRPASPKGSVRDLNSGQPRFDGEGEKLRRSASSAPASTGVYSTWTPLLQEQLEKVSGDWVRAERENSESLGTDLFRLVDKAVQVLGTDFFQSEGPSPPSTCGSSNSAAAATAAPAPPLSTPLPEELSENAVLTVASQLSSQWQAQAKAMVESVRKAMQILLVGNTSVEPQGVTMLFSSQHREELSSLMLRALFASFMEANWRLTILVTRYYGENTELRSKLVNNTTVLHEVSRILEKAV